MPPENSQNQPLSCPRLRVRTVLRGAVQGVGFRPFVHHLATELALTGWVNNSPQGVFLEVEGERSALETFLRRLQTDKPPLSFIQSLETTWLDAAGFRAFEIRASDTLGAKSALVLPDIATCPDCLREIRDPRNRRYRYPFTNCTHCGPRFSIIEALPYDRANTAMKAFVMCPACQAEYDLPADRRFHAQPNACPVCGPHLEFWRPAGDGHEVLASHHDALLAAAQAIRAGQIVAVKGIGGFHLLVDARNDQAVQTLRERKHREEKPFALLFPTLESAREACEISPAEERLLVSPEAPIVLLRQRAGRAGLSPWVAPGNPNLGVLLPSNPAHHLLMAELGFPVVATSGNLSDEPLCTDECEALGTPARHRRRFSRPQPPNCPPCGRFDCPRGAGSRNGAAPRPRFRPLADSLAREPLGETILAVGAHLKNAVALATGGQVIHQPAHWRFGNRARRPSLPAGDRRPAKTLRGQAAQIIAADLHPDYLSTRFARESQAAPDAPRVVSVQHHIAHTLSCMTENEVPLPALGVAWDGTGYGTDGTIWGGEFFLVTAD